MKLEEHLQIVTYMDVTMCSSAHWSKNNQDTTKRLSKEVTKLIDGLMDYCD